MYRKKKKETIEEHEVVVADIGTIDPILIGQVYFPIKPKYVSYSTDFTKNKNTLAPTISLQIAPNPFSNQTNITYTIDQSTDFSISVYNTNGQKVADILPQQSQSAGTYTESFEAYDLPKGIYLVRIQSPENTQTIKILKME